MFLSAALKQAIREGNTLLARRALAVPGFNPDTIDTASGMTLLMWAATCGKDDIVRLLLRKGAGVNTDQKTTGMTALMHAAEQVCREIFSASRNGTMRKATLRSQGLSSSRPWSERGTRR